MPLVVVIAIPVERFVHASGAILIPMPVGPIKGIEYTEQWLRWKFVPENKESKNAFSINIHIVVVKRPIAHLLSIGEIAESR